MVFVRQSYTVKTNPPFWESYNCSGYKTKSGVERILVIFQHSPVQPHQWKALAETFWMILLDIGLFWKVTKYVLPPFWFPTHNRYSSLHFFFTVYVRQILKSRWRRTVKLQDCFQRFCPDENQEHSSIEKPDWRTNQKGLVINFYSFSRVLSGLWSNTALVVWQCSFAPAAVVP